MKIPCTSGTNVPKLIRCVNLAVFLVTAIAGCHKTDNKPSPSQVAARVNGHEITIHQVNDILSRQAARPEQAEALKRQVLERLIDQELARQQAVENKLDRNPRTVQAIEFAKNEILSRAYIDQIAGSQPKP